MGKQKEVAKIWKKGLSKLNINIVLIAVLLLMFFTFNVTSENFITNDSSLNNDYELDWIASPEVNAEFPEDNTTNTTTNVIDFTYNVSVYPSDIDNCSLMINDEVNFTDLSNITTGETHNLTVYLPNGEYLWSVNCTANLCFGSEPQACAGQSETRNISVGYVTGSSIRSCYSCENCSLEIENAIPGDTVQLGNDISDYQDTFCINISKADITFDCKGYIISNLTATKNGINVYTSNVTIKNCLIANSSAGIYAGDSIDGKGITNLTIVDTVIQTNTNEDGIYLLNVAESTLDNITITLKGGNGFGVSLVEDGERNVSLNNITNINIVGSSWTGLLIEGPGSGNLIQNLTITDYSYSGISLSDTWNNTLKNVNLTNMWNYGTGLYVSETSDVFLDGSGRQNDPAQYIQDIDESNIIDGLPIKYYDGYYTPCPNNEIIEHNNTYSVIGMVGCWNVTLQNTELIDGLHLYFTENSTVQNLNSSGSLTGIRLWYGSGNYLSNLTLWSDFQGILYYGTTNNTINEADIRNSLGYGMDIWWSDYNTIENSTVISGSYEGVSLDDSQHNTIRNLNITSNSQNGIKLSTYSLSGSHYNNITQCNITSNAVGIYIDTNSIGSNIYDNILNNTLNAQVYNSSNYFNNTKTLGTNIIGGPYIGGNYWSDYYGNDTNSDGIGDDDTYNITTNTYDYLPLVTYTPAQDTAPPNIEFVDPTQPDLTVTSYTNAEANISIIEKELANFKWNWNGTNYSIYDDDLVLMLNFDNNSALGENDTYVVDVSRYGNNGTFYSNGTETHGYTTNGKYDGGWLFDGDGDYIITNTSLPINGNNTFTISVWIKLDDDTHINTIVEKYTFTDGMDLWVNYQTAGKASLILADGVDICVVQSASNVTDNNWHHVVGIRDVATSNLSIYIDGVFENETNSSACNNAGDPQKFISIGGMDSGADGSVDTNYFNGTIDEIRIYNRSLTAEEIRQQYYSTLYKYDTDKWVFYTNQQNLSFGNYTYFGAATDADGNENMTEIRNIEITAPPTIIPFEVLFVDPTPSDMAENNYSNVEVNISITGMENLTKFVWDWNETNYSIYDDDLVLMLNFDNNLALGENDTYVVDISRYGNNGTVYNGTIWTSEGKYEGGYSFDGENDVIVIADSPTLSSRNFTIEAWVKLNELGKDDIIVGKAAEYWLVYNHTELSCDIEKFGLSIFNGTGWKCVSTTNKPSIDTWYYLTAIYNGTDISIYVNSILEGGPVNHQNPSDSVYTLDIGSYSANASSYAFNGTIDEVRMYNRSLTSEEIKQHYYSNLQKYDIDKWAFFINESNVTVGNYTYFGAAQNIEGNENMTEVRNVVMKSFVDIQLVWPEESIKINGREINFTYNVSEQNIVGCTLVLNDQYNETNQTEIATDDYNNISVNLTTGSYTWRVECVNDLGQIASSPTSTFSLSNVYFTLRNYTFTELNRTANSFPIEIINEGPDTATAIYAENSTGIELVASSFIGPGSYDIRLTLSPENYFNLTYGANLAQAQTETYVIPIRLMDENGILLDESEIELYLKAFGNYSLASEPSNWTISPDLTDNTTVCSTTKLNITIANNGSADIHDLNVNTSGELNITLNPIIFNQRIMENELKSFMAYAVVDENTPNATATITISGGNTSIEIPIEYTKVFGSWPTPPVIDQQSYTASASGFLCVNYQSYTVNLNIPSNIDLDTLLDARIILSFSNACGSDQAHDTYIYFNGYLVAAYFNQAMFGTYTIRGIKPYVRHSNTLYVTSSNYAATGHYCANTNNALRVDVGTTTTYCPEAFCTPTEESETNCDDHIDSDCDGVADCLDQDCCSNSSCEGTGVCTSVENCTDNFDNDGNGLTDCNDVGPCCVASEPSCYGTPACSGVDYWVCDEGNVISQCIINSTKDATTVSVKTLRDLIIGTNGSLVMNESRLTVTNLEVLPNGNITGNLNLTVANLIVHEGGLITASGRYGLEGYGFCNGTGPGAGQSYVTPSYYEGGGGGAYGGYGSASLRGVYSPQFNYIAGGTPYGSIEEPLEKGSSGGNPWGSHYYPYATGGCGGGLIIINASDTVNITGTVESNGGRGEYPPGYSTSGGGGSGGSIYIRANTFTGTGSITANGGTSVMTTAKGGGGSGGRIAIYYWTDSFTGSISSIGGDGWHDSGGPLITIGAAGTIYTKGEDYPLGNLTIANTGKLFPHQATPINGTFEKLTVQNNTNLSIIGGSYTNVGYMDAVINYSIIEIGEGSVFNISDKNLSLYDNSSVYICPTCELDISNYALINDTVYIRAEGNLTVGLDAFDTLGGTIWTNSSINLFYKIENITIIYAGGEFTTVDNNLTVGNLSVLEVETDRTLNFSNLVVEASGTIKHSYNWFTRLYILNITAENITVEAGGTITGDYAGYWREYGPGAGKNATQTESPYSGGGGASHGGLGGRGGGYKPGAGGSVTYGSIEEPIELGSGGGNATGADYDIVYSPLIYTRSAGGGVVILNVTEILNITGDVSADGEQGWDVPSYWAGCGGGSGGSVFINTNTITGDGNITANGGAGNYGSVYGESGGGGGGRIAIYYGINDFNGMITAYGGSPGYIPSPPNPYYVSEAGGAGTIYIKDYNYEVGNLTIDNNNKGLTGTEINGTFEYLNISNAANVTVGDGAFLNISELTTLKNSTLTLKDDYSTLNATKFLAELTSTIINNGNITFEIFNFINTITVLSNGITNFSYSSFENLTLIYQGGTFEFPENNLTLGNATTLEFRTTNELNLSVVELLDNSLITHTLNTYSQDYIVNLSAENLSIATGARINVNSKGYAPNYGPGNGTSAETQPTPRSGAGAGYGGLGGNASNSTDVYLQEGQTYGSKVRPLQIGSGGGNCTANSVAFYGGGGLVFLNVTDTLTLNGYISANGSDGSVSTPPGNSSSVGSGGGSGGAIYLYVNNIIGSGDIMADGGKGGQGTLSQGGGGGGGRIAVYYHTREFTGQNTTYGGTGLGNGEEGTVYWNDMIPPNITLVQPEINGTVETDGTVNFTFVVSSDVDVVNCTAYVNNEAYAENTSDIYLDSDYNITTFLIPGTYDWNMHCIDDGDYEGISETWNFTLVMETTPPTVSLEYPDDNDILSLNLIDFLYNVTDNFIVANCSLIINDEVNITTTEPIHQNEAGLNLTTYLHDGDYTWSINCTDTANNEGASETRNVSIGYVARNITIELLEPTADTSVQQYALFNFTVNVSCYDADCGNINVSLDPEWYNTEWQYRQKVYVSEGSDTLDGYQLNISINSANNGTNFNWSRECEDIRFTNIYNTELKYWIESCNSANQAAAIFVKLDNTITQANPYIYMYYGNDEVTNNSNGTETFDFYDDFLDENINPEVWYNQTSGSGYAMNIENGALNLSVVYNGAGQASVVSYAQFTTNKSVETLARVRYQGTYDYNIMFSNLYGLTAGQITYTGSSDRWYIGSGNSYERITTDNWYKMQMVANDTAVNLYVNDTFKASSPISNTTTSIKVMAYIPDASWDDVSHSQYDWIRVRRYMDIQPNYTIGEEVPVSEASTKGLISTTYGTVPFFINSGQPQTSNPQNITLNQGESMIVTWRVNTTGTIGSTYKFFAYANWSYDESVSASTQVISLNITEDITAPTVILEYPENDAIITTTNLIDFNYSIYEPGDLINCTLIINDEINATDTTMQKDVSGQNFTVYLPNGDYFWSVNCTDTLNQIGASETRNLSIVKNLIPPEINFVDPTPNDYDTIIVNYTTINVTVSENVSSCILSWDPWWNTNWYYRQKINLSVTSDALPENYQVNIVIDKTNNGTNFNWSRECEDIRFVNQTDDIELPYWIESCNTTIQNASIWVNVSSNITTETLQIYMYYGNDEVTNNSNGSEVFELFDEFDGSSLNTNIWNYTGTVTVSGGFAQTTVNDNSNKAYSRLTYLGNYSTKLSIMSVSGYGRCGFQKDPTVIMNQGEMIGIQTDGGTIFTNIGNTLHSQNADGSTDTVNWHTIEMMWLSDSAQVKYDGANLRTLTDTSYVPDEAMVVKFADPLKVDRVFLRKYSATEPVLSFEAEESNAKDTTNYTMTFENADALTTAYYTVDNLTEGVNYTYWVTCVDLQENGNVTELRHVLYNPNLGDTTPPDVYLELPEDGITNTTTNMIDFTYNVSDDGALANCSLIINDEINMTDTTMIKDTAGQNFTLNLNNGEYNWSINCTDNSNNIGASETRNITIDIIPPEVIIPFEIAFVEPTPPDLTQTTNTSIEVNISITWMENLTTFIWDWNGTNYSIYDGDLALMLNFENNSALGENDTYVVDISRYGNNGTVENGTTWTSDGKFFGGYSFDGVDDYIDFGDVNEAEDTSGTFIFWVKRSNTNSSSSAVISKSYTIENIARWVTVSNNGSGTLSIFDGSWHTVTINGGIDEEEWEHIAAVWGTQGMKIYLNGELKGSDPYTGNGYTGSFPLVLGEWKEQIAGNYGFKGTLDEVRIYNRSLSQEEIQQHYYSTLYKYDVDKWAFYTNQSNLSLGNYTYYAKATDMDNNENMTETRNVEIVEEIVADNNPPLINLELPEDNATNTTTNSIDFTYNVSDASSLDNCTLIINEEINMTDTTMQKDTPGQNFTVYLPNADYLWSINCTDSSNNIGSSETRNLSVDYISAESTPPIVNLELPEDNTTNITTNTIDFTYNVSDASDVINCSLIINNQINISDSTNISKETTNNLTTYLPDATYNWSVNCTDESNNIGNSETRTITVTFNDIVAPTINLEMPKAGARNITSKTIDFTYNFSEDREIANCTLIIQNQINVTDTNMLNDTAGQNLTAYLPNGAYNWSVNCTDNSNNIGASETRTIKVLDANISITLNPNILYGTGSTDVAGTANLTDFNNLTYQDVFLYIDEVCLTCNYILGDGSDGVVTISSTETVINEYTHLEQNATAGDTILIVNDTTGFSNGDEILIVQMQGNTTTTEPGTYEFIRNITVDNGTQISFPTGLLNEYSTGVFNNNVTANYVTQIISVPNYENLTITGSVTAPSWNGYEGGIVVFKVNDTLTIQEGASINVSARGFRGGLNGTSGFLTGGYKSDPGESIMGLGVPDSQQPNYGGGGAGKLDPAGGTGGAGGGGGGSYGGKGTDGETILGGTGGKAGNIIGREDSQLLMLGSGGGGGAEGDAGNMAGMYSGRGGNGSGAVYIIGKNIIVNGVIEANGESGYNGSGPVGFIPWYGAGGGGGSGGLIYLKAENLFLDDTTTDSTLIAEGANGGYSVSNGTEIGMGGDGGNGSYGRIRLDYLTLNGFAGRNEGVEENTTNPDPEHTDTFMESTLKTNSLGNYTYELPSPITDGNYTIKVNSTYYWITIEAEEVLTVLTLDTTPPTINLEMPENNEINTTTNVIDFTYNVSDNSDIDNCSMIINEEINLTYSGNITKETTQNLTTYLPNGEYKWSINCTDAENNEGSSETRNITIAVNTIPNFELIYDFSLDEDFGVLNINLQDNVSDAEDADSSLTYNWTVNDTSILTLHIINTTGIATFTSQANASGSVLVAISVVDTGGLSNSTEFTITVNAVNDAPWMDLDKPDDDATNITTNSIDFTYTPHDVESSISNCSLIINDEANLTESSITVDAVNNLTTYLPNGEYLWSVNCTDAENYEVASEVRNLSINVAPVDTTAPTIHLEGPADHARNTTTNTVDFTYNVSEDNSLENCSLIINDQINMTDTNMLNGVAGQNFTVYLPDGDYYWSINCTDASNNIAASEKRNVSIRYDSTPPTINLESPADATTWTSSSTVTFYYNVSDASNLANCSLIIDYSPVDTSTTMQKDTAGQTFSYSLSNGDYLWSVNCTDENNNIGSSEVWNLTVSYSAPPPGGGGGGGGGEEPPVVPPVVPPVTPPVPPAPPIQPPVTPPTPEAPRREEAGRTSLIDCWIGDAGLTQRDIESLGYMINMVECPNVTVNITKLTKKTWCNGIEIGVEDLAALKIGYLDGKAQYNLNFGGYETRYCPWCYNGIQDYDEQGVDCGPSCISCVRVERPSIAYADLKCGDNMCDEGNQYVCPEDCRDLNRLMLVIILLIIALIINTLTWDHYRRKGTLTRTKNITFGLINTALGGMIIYVVTQTICVSPLDCEYFMTIMTIIAMMVALFLIVLTGPTVIEWVKLKLMTKLGMREYIQNYKDKKEIKEIIKEAEKLLEEDVYAAEVMYTTIKPLYDELPVKQRRKVIGRIKKLYKEIMKKKGGR